MRSARSVSKLSLPLLSIPFLSYATASSANSTTISTGSSYTISPSSFPSLCVVPSADNEGAGLQVVDCDASDYVAWTYDGAALKNSASGQCADVIDGSDWSGNGVQVWGCYSSNSNQQFNVDNGLIRWSGGNNMCLDLTDGNGVDGTPIQIWSCSSSNPNQQWIFDAVEEVDDCDVGSATNSSTVSSSSNSSTITSFSNSTSANITTTDDSDDNIVDCDDEGSSDSYSSSNSSVSSATQSISKTSSSSSAAAVSASASQSILGGELYAGGNGGYPMSSSASDSWDASSTDAWAASSTESWGTSSTSDSWGASSTTDAWGASSTSSTGKGKATGSASASAAGVSASASVSSGSSDFSGYLQVSGTNVVDASGNTIQLRGTNLGGWLVWEDWMCGITDNSGSADRFPQTTLESRFGEDQTRQLMKTWQDNWLVSSDFDVLKSMGFNLVRLPFSYKNFIYSNGSYITDSSGNVDFSRLDWAVAQAKSRGIYVVLVYHIWDGQEEGYSTISEDSDDGQSQRDKCGDLWTKIATHFSGESAIAGFDAINEPTGSAGNILQRDLYNAIRQGDSKRIIIMESISSAPDSDWTNVMYSMHEYLMMGEDDESYNQQQFQDGVVSDINQYTGNGVPTYIAEFMASGDTLTWMLGQLNDMGVWWSGWTYKTVNMDRWGLYNFGSDMSVTVSSDSFDSINSAWSNMGSTTKSRVADAYASACSGSAPSKRDFEEERDGSQVERTVVSPRAGSKSGRTKRFTPHAGRSRLAHGRAKISF